MEEIMSLRLALAAAALGVALMATSASARDRYYDHDQVWGDAVREHKHDEAISARTVDVMRQRPRHVFDPSTRPHDPSGAIILEGAR
jgi:hypothetical protein